MLYNKRRRNYPPDAVLIDRTTPWGNPYSQGTREQNIADFEEHVLPTLDVEPLRGKDLLCWCVPKACHGHSIQRKLRQTRPEN